MLDLSTIDPETVLASPEFDQYIAEKWMEWYSDSTMLYWMKAGGKTVEKTYWQPSIDPAHTGEARREADMSEITHRLLGVTASISTYPLAPGGFIWHSCTVAYSETNGDKGKAEALATCRAIVAVLKAANVAGAE